MFLLRGLDPVLHAGVDLDTSPPRVSHQWVNFFLHLCTSVTKQCLWTVFINHRDPRLRFAPWGHSERYVEHALVKKLLSSTSPNVRVGSEHLAHAEVNFYFMSANRSESLHLALTPTLMSPWSPTSHVKLSGLTKLRWCMLPLHVTLVKVKWYLVSRVQLLSEKSELMIHSLLPPCTPQLAYLMMAPPPEAHRLSALADAGSGSVPTGHSLYILSPLLDSSPPLTVPNRCTWRRSFCVWTSKHQYQCLWWWCDWLSIMLLIFLALISQRWSLGWIMLA